MHLLFERSKGRFKSNCNILTLAWMPYYNEVKFRQALFEYHQKQLITLSNGNEQNQRLASGIVELQNGRHQRSGNSRSAIENNEQQANNPTNDRTREGAPSSVHKLLQKISNRMPTSRLAELHRRYVYSRYEVSKMRFDPTITDPLDLFEQSSGDSMSDQLDLKYGRMQDFGWLVVGNIGKIVGVTLTSTTQLAAQELETPRQSSSAACVKSKSNTEDEDLIAFHKTDPLETQCNSDNNNSNASNRSKLADQSRVKDLLESHRPDRKCLRNNYNLRGHLGEVILVRWNELYQKLATVDTKGNVLIWCKINEKFTIQTPFYNRTKSVADFKWSNDGKTALICYTDSFILVGSSSGQRHWHSMLNLDEYHITCAAWNPSDEQILLGVSNGNVVIIDLPRSELTELVVNQTNIRAMSWSSCELNLRNAASSSLIQSSSGVQRVQALRSSSRTVLHHRHNSSTIVNHRRLSRDCSVFSRFRSQNLAGNDHVRSPEGNQPLEPEEDVLGNNGSNFSSTSTAETSPRSEDKSLRFNILAMDFANNTIKLFNGCLADPQPSTIQVNLESYIMAWTSDGRVLGVAGFNISTSAPSIGCLKCQYSNWIKFYDRRGNLIYEYAMKHKRYPITALTWAHNDQRIFVATGPILHCARVFFEVPRLSLLAMSCFQQHTKLSDKFDVLDGLINKQYNENHLHWQSFNCPVSLRAEKNRQDSSNRNANFSLTSRNGLSSSSGIMADESSSGELDECCKLVNNANVALYRLPTKIKSAIDNLFSQTIRQPFNDQLTLTDIVWQVPKHQQHCYCTLVCYTSDQVQRDPTGIGQQYRTDLTARVSEDSRQAANDQYKIFILYVEFLGSLIPILKARRIGFLKPEFVILDPEDVPLKSLARNHKVSDVSFQPRGSNQSATAKAKNVNYNIGHASPLYQTKQGQCFSAQDNCSVLHSTCGAKIEKCLSKETNACVGQNSFESKSVGLPKSLILESFNRLDFQTSSSSSNCDPYLAYLLNLNRSRLMTSSKQFPRTTDLRRTYATHKSSILNFNSSQAISETNELVRIRSNIWGTKFKILNVGNRIIKQRALLGSVTYKASVLHLQPRQIFLNVKDMSNYCILCSTHHHSRSSTSKRLTRHGFTEQCSTDSQKTMSLIDMPNSNLELQLSEARRARRHQFHEDKVVLPVGDNIRIAPMLERNQRYKFAEPSTGSKTPLPTSTRGLSGISLESTPVRPRRSGRSLDRDNPQGKEMSDRRVKCNIAPNIPPRLYVAGKQTSDAPSSSRETGHLESNDVVLTLSLGQGDQVCVEMSPVESKLTNAADCVASTSKQAAANELQKSNTKLDQFLESNKTLKSIQTITKMIAELSSRAADDATEDSDYASKSKSSSSPAKLLELSESRSSSSRYIPPEAPVHRPRRSLVRRLAHNETQSATTTPLRSLSSRSSRARERHRNRAADPQPPLPPPLPAHSSISKISSSAKRFINGSLRSLYNVGGIGGYSTTDNELDLSDYEPLVSSGASTRTSRNRIRNGKRKPLHLQGQSAPCTPARGANDTIRKQSANVSSFNTQLAQRLRASVTSWLPSTDGKSLAKKLSFTSTRRHSSSCDRNAKDHIDLRKSSWKYRDSREPCGANLHDNYNNSSTSRSSSSPSLTSSSASSLSEFRGGYSDTDGEYNCGERFSKPSRTTSSTSGCSSSTRDLRQSDESVKFGRFANLQQQKQRLVELRQRSSAAAVPTAESSTKTRKHTKRRRRKKSICQSSNCCCAQELKLSNRPPVWNELSQVYQLDFGGRVTQESAKNLQIDFDGNLALQFGRIDRCTYTLDYKCPFNAIQAMAIALASLTQRMK